ncbi:hypothetical protein R3P38DRAFT_2906426 [Favolaschia claudopus]|uniref:F-box domain-containing protein n=1 Tax=Favolaschia claudopus TaxID=2862362 RepID=A0AAW0CLK8_9AGAR
MSSRPPCAHCDPNQPRRRSKEGFGTASSPQQLRTDLAEVRSQILLYTRLLAALEEDEEDLENRLAKVVYPVLNLPFEVTAAVFIRCLPGGGPVTPTSSTAPLALSHVCRQWRDVALSSTELWDTLHVDLNAMAPWLLEMWFSRAKERPLSLTIDGESHSQLEYVSANTDRFKYLNLYFKHSNLAGLPSAKDGLRSLLPLASYNTTEEAIWSCLENNFGLREHRILPTRFVHVTFDYHSPGSNLTHLELLARISGAMFLKLLRRFPALSHLKCSPHIQPNSIQSLRSEVAEMFPNIRSLGLPARGAPAALPLVSLPNLTSLELGAHSKPVEIRDFLIRSSCYITCLRISLADCDEKEDRGETAALLSLFPFVRSLEAIGLENLTIFISCLYPRKLLPEVTELTAHYDVEEYYDNTENYGDNWILLLHRMSEKGAVALTKAHIHLNTSSSEAWSRCYPGRLAQAVAARLIEEERLDLLLRCQCQGYVKIWPCEDDDDASDPDSGTDSNSSDAENH